MLENARLSSNIGRFDLDFMEREATPSLLMKLSIQVHLARLSLSNTVSVSKYSVLNSPVPPFITGCTKPIYSRRPVEARVTSPWTKP